jgi:hypothetical protein
LVADTQKMIAAMSAADTAAERRQNVAHDASRLDKVFREAAPEGHAILAQRFSAGKSGRKE